MKKFIFFYLIIVYFSYSEISDVSFAIKGGYAPLGFYTETLTGSQDYTEKTTLVNSLNAKIELYSRTKSLENFYFGVGLGYEGDGTIGKSLLGNTKLGVDYYPVYLIMQYEPPSEHYFDWLMYFNFRFGASYEKDKGRIQGSTKFTSIYSFASPYVGFSWGFEKYGFMAEAFYEFNVGASTNLADYGTGSTELGDTILMQSRRIGLSLGYRINSGYRN